MLIGDYFAALRDRIAEIESQESGNIARAAEMCAKSIEAGGVIHMHDTGHMLNTELVHRAGGLTGFTPFSFGLSVNNPNLFRDKNAVRPDVNAETIALALKSSNVRSGDVMFIGSVSGKSARVVELALQAKTMGVRTVGLTSLEYSAKLESEHPSGKRLFEVVELALDNHAPYGDAMLDAPGLDVRVCPASGVNAAIIMWAVIAGTVDLLLRNGTTPTVFMSANAPGGMEDVKRRQERYKELGH